MVFNFVLLFADKIPGGYSVDRTVRWAHLEAVPLYWVGASTLVLLAFVVLEIVDALRQRIKVGPGAVPRVATLAVWIDAILVVSWLVIFCLAVARSVPW